MKVNEPNLIPAGTPGSGSQKAQEAGRTAKTSDSGVIVGGPGGSGSNDDVHLSELVRSLRALAADSPERQAHIESIARTHAQGSYAVNAEGTAVEVIREALVKG
jgi:hypothetical protein